MAHWYAIEIKPKGEDKAERDLRNAGFSVYAPVARFERWNKRKKVNVERSVRLMPRYMFISARHIGELWRAVHSSRLVSRVLGANGLPSRLNHSETAALEAVMKAEQDYEFDTTSAARIRRGEIGKSARETARIKFPVGSHVRITKGPLASFTAEVTTVNGRGKLEALVSIFGRTSPVELPVDSVEVANMSEAA